MAGASIISVAGATKNTRDGDSRLGISKPANMNAFV